MSYSAVITPSESGRLQNLTIPSADIDEQSGKWVKNVGRKYVIKETTLGSQIHDVLMTRRKSDFVYRLDDSVTMDMINTNKGGNYGYDCQI